MKHFCNSLRQLTMIAISLVVWASCSDNWDDHYSTNGSIVFDSSIAELLSIKPDASKFVEALKTTKMLKINNDTLGVSFYDFLSSDQFVTVWVPSNESLPDSLWDEYTKIGKTTKEHELTAKKLIMNHIARYNYSLGSDSKKVIMMNGKTFMINSSIGIGSAKYLKDSDNKSVINVACSNGIVHFLNNSATDGSLPYLYTIYEFLTMDSRYRPLIGQFLDSYTVEELDEDASVASGINDEGEMVYIDSVTYKTNILLSSFGRIDREDSSFVMVIPTPEGWTTQYNKLLPQFQYSPKLSDSDSLSRLYSHVAMINDAFFNMNLQKSPKDSVCSTQYSFSSVAKEDDYEKYHKFFKPYDDNTGLFRKGFRDSVICSNGVIYITDDWNFDQYLVYNTPLIANMNEDMSDLSIDPEKKQGEANYGIFSDNYNSNTKDGVTLLVQGSPFTLNWALQYTFKNVLRGKYRLKLVVNQNSVDITDHRPLHIHPQVIFYEDGNVKNSAPANILTLCDEKTGSGPRQKDKYYPTSSTAVASACDTIAIDKIIDVPYCTYGRKTGSLQIRIVNGVTTANLSNTYNPFMYLDRIILEPVKE